MQRDGTRRPNPGSTWGGQLRFVALLLLEDPNIGAIMLGANEVLPVADRQMVNLVSDFARDTERVARHLSGGFVDGAIIVSARTHDPITRVIAELGLPATFVGHPPDLHRSIPFVGIDNVGSARAITERLAVTGRQRIAMIAAALDQLRRRPAHRFPDGAR